MAATAVADPAPEQDLKRVIGRKTLLVFIVGDVLGAGIYALVGEVGGRDRRRDLDRVHPRARSSPSSPPSPTPSWSRSTRAPPAPPCTSTSAFGIPFLSFMVAFAVMASGVTSASTLARGFGGDYLKVFVDIPIVLTAIVFLLVVAAINFRGISESVKLNLVLTAIELTGLLLICLIAAAAVFDGASGTDAGRAFEFKADESVIGAMVGGAGLAFYALIGFEDSVNVAEETKEPSRNYPFALFGGLAVAGIIYIAVTILASMAVPTDTLAGSTARCRRSPRSAR